MRRHVTVLALVVCVVLAGCGGPGTENETTTESTSNATRAVALPPNETVVGTTTGETTAASRAAILGATSPALVETDGDGVYAPSSSDWLGFSGSSGP